MLDICYIPAFVNGLMAEVIFTKLATMVTLSYKSCQFNLANASHAVPMHFVMVVS